MHPHTGEAGAIGAAMETLRVVKRKGKSTLHRHRCGDRASNTSTKNDEETVCHFCPNECKRTFIDTKRPDGSHQPLHRRLLLREGHRRDRRRRCSSSSPSGRRSPQQFPNMRRLRGEARVPALLRRRAACPTTGSPIKDVEVKKGIFGMRRVEITRPFKRSQRRRRWRSARRMRIGIPRVLNIYSTAPWFRTYFEALGIPKQNVVFSDATTEEMWVEGGKYGSIDPCYPSKVAQAHIHNLLFHQHTGRRSRSSTSSSRSSRT